MREYGFAAFGVRAYRTFSRWLTEQARGTDHGMALVTMLVGEIRRRRTVVPALPVVERLVLAFRARARRDAYAALSADLTPEQRTKLDRLLDARPVPLVLVGAIRRRGAAASGRGGWSGTSWRGCTTTRHVISYHP